MCVYMTLYRFYNVCITTLAMLYIFVRVVGFIRFYNASQGFYTFYILLIRFVSLYTLLHCSYILADSTLFL